MSWMVRHSHPIIFRRLVLPCQLTANELAGGGVETVNLKSKISPWGVWNSLKRIQQVSQPEPEHFHTRNKEESSRWEVSRKWSLRSEVKLRSGWFWAVSRELVLHSAETLPALPPPLFPSSSSPSFFLYFSPSVLSPNHLLSPSFPLLQCSSPGLLSFLSPLFQGKV